MVPAEAELAEEVTVNACAGMGWSFTFPPRYLGTHLLGLSHKEA